ncbi:hypothetical protein AVDCRST_MAG84-581 [uncultured Microcoleus sp.]|uniref:Uncharacterized protein n=1 Tax=uncultured Microcoleus sp. TaxID=259945 RepID=A0A6J4KKX7_9CYAN|nr:hypothetical protein AVDCRST_MAG84-581 [uncultured Microcoleus sp.]
MSEMVDRLSQAGLHRINLLSSDFGAKYTIIYDKFFAEIYHFDVFFATLNFSVKLRKVSTVKKRASSIGGWWSHFVSYCWQKLFFSLIKYIPEPHLCNQLPHL